MMQKHLAKKPFRPTTDTTKNIMNIQKYATWRITEIGPACLKH